MTKCAKRFGPNGIQSLDALTMRILQGPVAWDMTLTAFGTPTGEGSKSSIEENPDPRWGKRRQRRDLNGWHRHRFTGSDARDFGEEGWERKVSGYVSGSSTTFYRNTRRFGERVFRSRPQIRAWLAGLQSWHGYSFTGSDARDFGEEGWERRVSGGKNNYRNTRRFGTRVFQSRPAIQRWLLEMSRP